MLPIFKYKGFKAQVEYDDGKYCGTVKDIDDLIYFEGSTIVEAYEDFVEAIDHYREVIEGENNGN